MFINERVQAYYMVSIFLHKILTKLRLMRKMKETVTHNSIKINIVQFKYTIIIIVLSWILNINTNNNKGSRIRQDTL